MEHLQREDSDEDSSSLTEEEDNDDTNDSCTCHSNFDENLSENSSSENSSNCNIDMEVMLGSGPAAAATTTQRTALPLSPPRPQSNIRQRRRRGRSREKKTDNPPIPQVVAPTMSLHTKPTASVAAVTSETKVQKHAKRSRSFSRRRRNAARAQRKFPETENDRLTTALVVMSFIAFFLYKFQDSSLQTLVLTIAAICAVALAAAVLIYVSEYIERMGREKTTATSTADSSQCHNSAQCHQSHHIHCISPSQKQNEQQRRHSVSYRRSASPPSLNPITEHKMEDEFDYWWDELDSQTQYYALLLGYTPQLWDADYELEDLECEDLSWDELTKEQQAAAVFFGYTQGEWDTDDEEEEGDDHDPPPPVTTLQRRQTQ